MCSTYYNDVDDDGDNGSSVPKVDGAAASGTSSDAPERTSDAGDGGDKVADDARDIGAARDGGSCNLMDIY